MGDKPFGHLPHHIQGLIAAAVGKQALEYAAGQMPSKWYKSYRDTKTGYQRLMGGETSTRRTKSYKPKRKTVAKYKKSSGVGQVSAHGHKNSKTRTITKRKRKKKKKSLSNKALTKKVKKLENKTKLSKLYIHTINPWVRRDIGSNNIEWHERAVVNKGFIETCLSNVPYSTTHLNVTGANVNAVQDNRARRGSLIANANQTPWSLSINTKCSVKNVSTMPVHVSIYWCQAQKKCNESPLDYINSTEWRNVHYFSSEAQRQAYSEAAFTSQIAPVDSMQAWPTHHKDLVNNWKPKRMYSGTLEPAGHVTVSANPGLVRYNHHKYDDWEAFAESQTIGNGPLNQYHPELKSGYWLTRVHGVPVMNDDTIADDFGGPHGESSGTVMEMYTTNVTVNYRVPGVRFVNYDYVDNSNNATITSATHPGVLVVDNAEDVDPQPPPTDP